MEQDLVNDLLIFDTAVTLTAPPQREQISTSMSPKAPTVGKHSF
jgi:hypothetical protein